MRKADYLKFSAKDWYERGQRLTNGGRHSEAIEALNQAIAKNPAYGEAYFVRGACYYAQGHYNQAGNDIDAAALFGCRDAQFWSKHAIHSLTKGADDRQE